MTDGPFEELSGKVDARCLSDLALAQFAVGEAPSEAATSHLATCGRCRQVLEIHRGEAHAFAESADIASLAAHSHAEAELRARGRPWLRLSLLVPALAGATAALVLAIMPSHRADETAAKGSPVLRIYAARDGPPRLVASGDTVRPGERLRFVVDADRPIHVAVLGLDESGTVWRGAPLEGDATVSLLKGGNQALSGAVLLDERGSSEQVFFFACGTSRRIADLEAAVRSGTLPSECHLEKVVLRKER